jgi:spoIIIJ-associated protein
MPADATDEDADEMDDASKSPEAAPAPGDEIDISAPPELAASDEAALEKGLEALQRIIDFITDDAQVSVERNADRVLFDVKGGNAGVLIGRRGQTLESIQYIVEKIVNKNTENRIRVQVDIEGYLEGRRTRLQELAAKLSAKAKRSGKPVTLGQLNSHDRRIVHLSLRDDDAVRTQSQGDGFYRKLVIFPEKKGRKKKNG